MYVNVTRYNVHRILDVIYYNMDALYSSITIATSGGER